MGKNIRYCVKNFSNVFYATMIGLYTYKELKAETQQNLPLNIIQQMSFLFVSLMIMSVRVICL